MGIENEVHQSKFKTEYQKASINLMYTVSCINHHHLQVLKKFGLTTPQFNVLRILRGQHPKATTVNDLINRMIDKASNASRIVEKLRSKNLVERSVSSIDRRAVDVKISKEGLDLLAKIDLIEDEFFFGVNSLTIEEAVMLNHLLDKGRESSIKIR